MTIEILHVYMAMQGLCSYTTRSKEKKSLINLTAASRSVCLSSISFYVFAVMIFCNTRNSILIFFLSISRRCGEANNKGPFFLFGWQQSPINKIQKDNSKQKSKNPAWGVIQENTEARQRTTLGRENRWFDKGQRKEKSEYTQAKCWEEMGGRWRMKKLNS